ncbi:MAG TPA: cation:proton antiporter [Stellaceae bacterium]|nr:cation:proton antiporter [Stellaceae bacterium]
MQDVAVVALTIAGLLIPISFIQPLSERLHLPHSVLLAVVGVAIGAVSGFLLETPLTSAFDDVVKPLVNLPVSSAVFIVVFLPILLFQTALTIDVREMVPDMAPILMLAVVAVVVAAAAIGFSLSAAAGVPLLVALLLGAIVATTDPAAVVAIFRELGTPARLTRLVEGESLLNDAAAIVLFTLLLEMLVGGHHPSLADAAVRFAVTFLGGVVLGLAAARLFAMVAPLLGGIRTAEMSLTVALPYIVYILGDEVFDVSGVVAVVVCGLAVGVSGRARLAPENWAYLENVWEQIGFLAGSLIFVLASILVPKLLVDVDLHDALLLAILVAAAFLARALVLFVLLPVLSGLRLSDRVDNAYKIVITWGGLRGAVTLALALGVTEHPQLDQPTKTLVAVLSTGFVLFTLLVNGLTLRPLIRLLKLDRLSPLNQAIRSKVLAVSLADVRDAVRVTADQYGISPEVALSVTRPFDQRIVQVSEESNLEVAISDADQITIGLIALTNRERQLILSHLGQRTVPPPVVERLLRETGNLLDAARTRGIAGYERVAHHLLAYRWPFRVAHLLHRRLGIDRLLAHQLSTRFEQMLVRHLVLEALTRFAQRRLRPLVGPRAAEALEKVLLTRSEETARGLDTLRLQYPEHAEALERRFLVQSALIREQAEYRELFEEGLIGRELFDDLQRELKEEEEQAKARPPLDLGLHSEGLLRRLDFFQSFSDIELRALARRFRPRLALPDEVIIRKHERGDDAFFISSGAVEVVLANSNVRLGRGDFFGEMALLTGQPRGADVVALTYCQLLVLTKRDFQRFLQKHPRAQAEIDRVVADRTAMNTAIAGSQG